MTFQTTRSLTFGGCPYGADDVETALNERHAYHDCDEAISTSDEDFGAFCDGGHYM